MGILFACVDFCSGLCAWNNHYCWPGNCYYSGLTDHCSCDYGFRKVSDSGETTCQPTQKPSINTCDTVAIGPNGEKKRAMSSTSNTDCQYLADMYGNFNASNMTYNMVIDLNIFTSSSRPDFIAESRFGLREASIYIERRDVRGKQGFLYVILMHL